MTTEPKSHAGELGNSSIQGIQYLRAIAALMVVGHHARHYFPEADAWSDLGSRGVDIFFVISGFIMAHATRGYESAHHRLEQAGNFLAKRFVRVVPLYWLALLWTTKRVLLAGDSGTALAMDFAFIPHFHAIYTGSIVPALVPGWTINYEMFFYVIFAASMLLGRWRYLALSCLIAALVSLGAWHWTSALVTFYSSSLLLEFVLGIVVYFGLRRRAFQASKTTLALITLTGFALLAVEYGDAVRVFLHGPAAAIIVGSAVLWAQGLRLPRLSAIGDASYSIYLFHLASFWIAATVLHKLGVESPTPATVVLVISVHMAVAVVAGLLIHRLVERPLLALLRRPLGPGAPSLR